MKAEVNQETCIDYEVCKSICSEVFKMKEDGRCQVYLQNPKSKIPIVSVKSLSVFLSARASK